MYYIGIVLMLIEKAQKRLLEQIAEEEARDDTLQLYIDIRENRWDELEALKYNIKSYLTETAASNVNHDLIPARSYFNPCDSVDIFDFLSEGEVAEWNRLAAFGRPDREG